MSMISAEDLATHIPYGKDKAVSREFLCMLFGISDRAVRRLVHDARDAGHIIINDQTGTGYYAAMTPRISSVSIDRTRAERLPYWHNRNTCAVG